MDPRVRYRLDYEYNFTYVVSEVVLVYPIYEMEKGWRNWKDC